MRAMVKILCYVKTLGEKLDLIRDECCVNMIQIWHLLFVHLLAQQSNINAHVEFQQNVNNVETYNFNTFLSYNEMVSTL